MMEGTSLPLIWVLTWQVGYYILAQQAEAVGG